MLEIEQEENGPLVYKKTIVRRALNSVGSNEYRELYIDRGNGEEEEVIYDGDLACAYQTSTPFHAFGLLRSVHTTVSGLDAEMLGSDKWLPIDGPQPGAIGILERKQGNDGLEHRHSFICIDEEYAVHNDASVKTPQLIRIDDFRHHDGRRRSVEAYYIHVKLV